MTEKVRSDSVLCQLLARLAESKFSWFSSVRPDGRPHSVPICHVMVGGLLYLATPSNSVKVANLQSNPHVAVAAYLEDPEAGLIVEGVARLRPEFRSVVTGEFQQKYDWDLINDDRHDALIEVVPSKLIAWGQYGEGHWSKVEIQKVVQNGK